MQRDSQKQKAVVREKIQNGRKGDMRFEDEGGAEMLHWQKGIRLNNGGIQTEGVRGSHSVIRSRYAAGGQLQE